MFPPPVSLDVSAARTLVPTLGLFGVLVLSFVAANPGGIVRDMLLSEITAMLRSDIYAVAALAGAAERGDGR